MRQLFWCMVCLWVLSACQPSEDAPLPTLINPGATLTAQAPTVTPFLTPTPVPPTATIPPTATAVLPTATPSPTANPNAQGTIYYVYNQDSIVALPADGSSSTLIMTFGVGRTIRDLTLSPTRDLFAFVGVGNGSALEVWVMSLDGTYLQQISCLGYADVRSPRFTPDGQAIAWYAAPDANKGGSLYGATIAGSNDCPTSNGQRLLLPFNTTTFNGFAWSNTSTHLYYSVGEDLMLYDSTTQRATSRIARPGNGSILAPSSSADFEQLVFLQPFIDSQTGSKVGVGLLTDSSPNRTTPPVRVNVPDAVTAVQWSLDQSLLVMATTNGVYTRDNRTGRITQYAQGIAVSDGFARSDSEAIAYTYVDLNGTMQIARLDGTNSTLLTNHSEGTVSNPIWLR